MCAILFFILPIDKNQKTLLDLSWFKDIPWNVLLLFGGGLSKAFRVYEKAMLESIAENSPIFKRNPCSLKESAFKSKSHMVGAALNLKRR